jgi:hypothetical protein
MIGVREKMLLHRIKSLALVLCAIIIIGASTASYAQDNTDQLSAWRRAAELGNLEAAIELGDTYHNGWGVEKSEDEAFHWYLLAAKGGNDVAQFNIGQAYSTGRGIKQDYIAAFDWFQKAAAQDNDAAQNSVGEAYSLGQGAQQNQATAIIWFLRAENHHNTDAEYNLGEAYHNGFGVAKDDSEAIKYYHEAADKGNARANKRLMEIEGQTTSFHLKNIPAMFWLLIIMASSGAVFFIIEIKKNGDEKYDLKFIFSTQFGMLIFGAVLFYATYISCDPNGPDATFCKGGHDVGQFVSLLTAAAALTMNIGRSNASFGALYTLAQLIAAYTFFPAFIVEMLKKPRKRLK